MRPPRRRFVPNSENAIQVRVAHIYSAVGGRVKWLSQSRASRQTPGLPDLIVVFPHRAVLFHETKRPGGRQSPAQKVLQDELDGTPVRYVLGGADAAWHALEELGFVTPGTVTVGTA